MTSIADRLKESPMFNLSLSSKELFHSNFLYWITTTYNKQMTSIWTELTGVKTMCLESTAYREEENIDFKLEFKDEQQIRFEIKIKSSLYQDQLEEYSKKPLKNCTYIVLALTKPHIFEDSETLQCGDNKVKWSFLSFHRLADKLEAMSESEFESSYHYNITQDYAKYLHLLCAIASETAVKSEDAFNFHDESVDSNLSIMRDLRFADFYLKRKYEELSHLFMEELKKSGVDVEFGRKLNWKVIGENLDKVLIRNDFTRGQGLSDIKIPITKDLLLGIQIQGESYRLCMESPNAGIASKHKEKIAQNRFWFQFGEKNPKDVYPQKGELHFNKFGEVFFYRSINLGSAIPVPELVKRVVADVQFAQKNKGAISRLLES